MNYYSGFYKLFKNLETIWIPQKNIEVFSND